MTPSLELARKSIHTLEMSARLRLRPGPLLARLVSFWLGALAPDATHATTIPTPRPDVLFIVVDDNQTTQT